MAILLSQEKIENELKESDAKIGREKRQCIKHDNRAKFHTEPTQEASEITYSAEFLQWINNIIDNNKHEVFKHLMKLPIETVDFTEGVLDELKKVFHAQDRFIKHHFTTSELEDDYKAYLKEIGDNDFWQNEGFSSMKSDINSIMIVDMPRESIPGEQPEPYYFFLKIENLKSLSFDRNGNLEWIIFKEPKTHHIIHAFDSMFYRTFTYETDLDLISEVEHGLGFCPARFFWTEPFNNDSIFQKRSPLSNSLSKLDWLLSKTVFIKHETLYAGFPIDIMYEQQCTYTDDDGNTCEHGRVTKHVKDGVSESSHHVQVTEPCPQCGTGKPLLGAGTLLTAPARADSDDPDLIQGLHRVSADVKSLEWLENSIKKDEKSITWNMIGLAMDQQKEAMNEMQVAGNFESRQNVMLNVKDNFQKAHSFVLVTLAKLRYGSSYLGSTVNYGERFFLHSVLTLQENYKLSKDTGMPIFELANQQQQIMMTKYQNNPEMMERVKILSALEPFQTYTVQELLDIGDQFRLNPLKMVIKINFEDLINRFEREQMDIIPFMQFSDFQTKINFIQTKLEDYGTEITTEDSGSRHDPETDGATKV